MKCTYFFLFPQTRPITPFSKMTKDIVSEIIDDHKIIRNLAQRYENENNTDERQKIANTVIREIAVHSACEEINLYPAFEKHFTNGKEIADHSREEHLQVKKDLYKLDSMKVTDNGYHELFGKMLKELVHHIDEEESDFLPKFKETISQNELESLGASFAKTRVTAPTHPHPSAPDKPPAESLAGMTALPLDKTRDAVRDFVDTGRDKL
ncbi:unnamed protein product [Rhizophagus irregularis]|nr:unnamed protein product [Rhizophagus irregularis]